MTNSTTINRKLTGYKADVEISRTSRFSRLYIVALKVGFGCLSYLMSGLSLGLVYVLSEMDYFVLSGVFRGERFFSDDGYYFAKQVVLVYGVFGFGCVLLLGPIGRQCVILWSWLLTFGYICVCIFVYLGRMSEYGVLLMRFMSVISLISHMSLCNFMFFLFDPNVTDSNSVIYRVLGFILGYFVCCPIVSFVLLRINVCVGLGFCQSDPVDSAFEMCRIVLTIFSISLISSICLTFQFVYDYLTNTDTGFVWVPSLMISNKVVAKTLFNFIDFELLCVVWLVNPIIITLVPYTTASHSQFHTLTFTHKLTFSLTLFVILLIVHKDFVQQCFTNLGKLNMAIFNIMYTDGYIQLVDKHLRETPISTTPFPNYINSCSTDTISNTSIRKIENTVVVPGFVAYPYLEDPFDDIDNQDKYLLHNYNNSPDDGFSARLEVNYYSQFCKYVPFIHGSIDNDDQLLHSYNQQLFVSIFNIINSYHNQKDTIWKDINYLKYFYHLFPEHVNKFYSLFERYVNPKIEELKKSIMLLEGEKSSINCQITNLGETNETIENLSKEITENVKKLKETITKHDKFKSLVEAVKKQISDTMSNIQGMNKTKEIAGQLNIIVQEISQETKQNLEQVKQKFREHESEFKQKICEQVELIKEVLQQLADDGGKGKIKDLEEKIEELVCRPVKGRGKYGSLVKLTYHMFKLQQEAKRYLPDSYLKPGLRTRLAIVGSVSLVISGFLGEIKDKRICISKFREYLEKILKGLVKYKQNIRDVTGKLNRCCGLDKGEWMYEIDYGMYAIEELVALADIKQILSSLEEAEKAIRSVKGFKTSVTEWKAMLEEPFIRLVDPIPTIEENKLDEIKILLGGIKGIANIAKRHFGNAGRMLDYLTVFEDQNKEITELSIKETSLSEIGETIRGVSKAAETIKHANEAIEGVRQTLERCLEENPGLCTSKEQKKKEKEKMMPGGIDLGGYLSSLRKHRVELQGIMMFGWGLETGIAGISEDTFFRLPEELGIHGLSDTLNQTDRALYNLNEIFWEQAKTIDIFYALNKWHLNGTKNGSSIEKMVESIKEIPDKISELQSQVKYNMVLLKIVKSVNETLAEVKDEAGKLERIGTTLGYAKTYIKLIMQRYEYIESNIFVLSLFSTGLNNLNKFKGNIESLNSVLRKLKDNIRSMNIIKGYLDFSITKLKDYQKILGEIYGEIEHKIPQLIDLRFGTNSNGSLLKALGGSSTEKIPGSKGIIGHLTEIISKTIKSMKYLCEVQYSICCTKRKLECFVSSIETKVGNIKVEIKNVECSIESVVICFLKCSNKFITDNTKESIKRLLRNGGQVYNNELAKSISETRNVPGNEINENDNAWTVLSNTAIVESKFVASRLYESITTTDKMLGWLWWVENCECVTTFDFDNYIMGRRMIPDHRFEYKNSHELHSKYKMVDWGNHLCMCLVINNLLYPNLMRCLCYLVDVDFDTLSTMSRRFDNYNRTPRYGLYLSKTIVVVVGVFMRICDLIYAKYFPPLIGEQPCKSEKLICFCRCPNDPYYKYFISIIICISFLVENMFRFDEPAIEHLVQQISSVLDGLNFFYCSESKPGNEKNGSSVKGLGSELSMSLIHIESGKADSLSSEILRKAGLNMIANQVELLYSDGQSLMSKGSLGSWRFIVGEVFSLFYQEYGMLLHRGSIVKDVFGQLSRYTKDFIIVVSADNIAKVKKYLTCHVLQGTTNCEECNNRKTALMAMKLECCRFAMILYQLNIYGIFNSLDMVHIKQLKARVYYMIMMNVWYNKNRIKIVKSNIISNEKNIVGIRGDYQTKEPSNNNYTYNDAYRINTSRAHGSLKYIIIKMVLILIIVVMTIFIRVKIETDDEYKMDNFLAEENGMCECSVENNENGTETNNGIRTKENGAKNNGTRKSSRTKGMKKKSLMIVMSIISGLYLNVVIRDLYVVLSLEYNVWSYFVSVVVCLGLTCSLLSRYCVHLYDFVYVLEQYGLKMSKVESLVDDKFGGESGTSMISSQFVMLYGLLKSVVGDLTSALSMSVSQSSYNEMKDVLYPYKNMNEALHKMISGSNEYLSNLAKLRESVMESAIVGGCVDLYNVLDFLSYVLMSKTFFEFDEYQAYFHGNERYVAWRLGKSLNHNFFLVSYYRYSTIYSIDAQVQNLRLGEKHMATRNCMMLWRMFGEMEIELITLRSMCEESLDVPMTDIQKDLLKSRFRIERSW